MTNQEPEMFESGAAGSGIVGDISNLKSRVADLEDEVLRLRRVCQQAYERATRAENRFERALTEWQERLVSASEEEPR
jgi:outer membrane murein-binding lipoprotein Lpp